MTKLSEKHWKSQIAGETYARESAEKYASIMEARALRAEQSARELGTQLSTATREVERLKAYIASSGLPTPPSEGYAKTDRMCRSSVRGIDYPMSGDMPVMSDRELGEAYSEAMGRV